jgi:antiviral helicase SLH1
MPSAIDGYTTESDWLAQLMQMQEAIAALKTDLSSAAAGPEYGSDLGLNDEDFSGSGSSDSDDIFDYSDDVYDSYSSDELGEDEEEVGFTTKWLQRVCRNYCSRRFSGQEPHELADNIMGVLESDKNDDALQATLVDILGYEDLDLVSELWMHRAEIVASGKAAQPQLGGAEDVIFRLMTKEQRDAALRQADLEHKSRPLGPKLAEKSENYPHIYRAYNAGNTLSAFGKKYSLPVGSSEVEEKEYTEIKIPATKVGTVGTNEKLVAIKEMDTLCRKTFVGYKSLNRMQSLVYPVAYKTNENMLICAPTGAVRITTPVSFYHGDSCIIFLSGVDVNAMRRVKLMLLCSRCCAL